MTPTDLPHRATARASRTAAAIAALLVLGGCADGVPVDGPTSAAPTATAPTATASPTASPTAASTPPTASPSPSVATPTPTADLRVALATVGSGFDGPVHAFAHDGRTFVVEQVGRVTDLDSGEVWLDLTDRVRSGGEMGLLGVAVHPDGGHVVAHWTAADRATTLATYPLAAGVPDVAGEAVVLRVPQPAANHNGGTIAFGPDGMGYLALGDGGGGGDTYGNGQDPFTLLGTVLRLDLDDPERAVVPADNPFVDGVDGAPEVWAWGLRNPYRVAFGDGQLYIADVGQNAVEEVTVIPVDRGGRNLGWPQVEGDRCFVAGCDLGAFEPADVAYTHDETGGCSVIGGHVYDGTALPVLRGHFVYGDLCAGILRTVRAVDGEVVAELDLTDQVGSVGGVTGIGADADGELLLTFADGRVDRLVPG